MSKLKTMMDKNNFEKMKIWLQFSLFYKDRIYFNKTYFYQELMEEKNDVKYLLIKDEKDKTEKEFEEFKKKIIIKNYKWLINCWKQDTLQDYEYTLTMEKSKRFNSKFFK